MLGFVALRPGACGQQPARFAINDFDTNTSIPTQARTPALDLRPLSTGELLDRVFFLYRSRLLKFMALALVPAALGLLIGVVQAIFLPGNALGARPAGPASGTIPGLVILLIYPFFLVGYAIVQAATTRLVAQLYLSGAGEPGKALREAWPYTLRYIGIEGWKVWSVMWLPVVLGIASGALVAAQQRVVGGLLGLMALAGLVYGVIAYLRNSLAIPASVIENLTVRASMRRSKVLVSGRKWRIFLVYLLIALLYTVALGVQSPLWLLMAHTQAPVQHAVTLAVQLALSFVISLLLTPVASIALCLLYFDERVRREAFDIDFLLRGPEAALHVTPAKTVHSGAPGAGTL